MSRGNLQICIIVIRQSSSRGLLKRVIVVVVVVGDEDLGSAWGGGVVAGKIQLGQCF